MSEKDALILRIVFGIIAYVSCVILVIYGNTIPGWKGLGLMLLGLAGIITMLYIYNRRSR